MSAAPYNQSGYCHLGGLHWSDELNDRTKSCRPCEDDYLERSRAKRPEPAPLPD